MSQGNLDGFDATQTEQMQDYSPIPAGEYKVLATESKFEPTKKGDGEFLKFTWRVIEGEHKDRLLWSRLNLKNPNQKAVDIAQRELSSICHAVGVMRPKDSSELHGKPLIATVECEANEQKPGSFSNRIKKYAAINSAAPTAAKPAAANVAPWKR